MEKIINHSLGISNHADLQIWWKKLSSYIGFWDNSFLHMMAYDMWKYMSEVKNDMLQHTKYLLKSTDDPKALGILNNVYDAINVMDETLIGKTPSRLAVIIKDKKFIAMLWDIYKWWFWDKVEWTYLFNTLSESLKEGRSITESTYKNTLMSSFGDEKVFDWATFNVIDGTLRALANASRKVSWMLWWWPALVTSIAGYAWDLDTHKFMWLGWFFSIKDLMKDFWLFDDWEIRKQVWDFIKDEWVLNQILWLIKSSSSEWWMWLTKYEFDQWMILKLSSWLNNKWYDVSEAAKFISQIDNGRQDIADIIYQQRIKNMAFERAAQYHWGSIDMLATKWYWLQSELKAAQAAWDIKEIEKIQFNIYELKNRVANTYNTNQTYWIWLPQDYWLAWWKLYSAPFWTDNTVQKIGSMMFRSQNILIQWAWWLWKTRAWISAIRDINRRWLAYFISWQTFNSFLKQDLNAVLHLFTTMATNVRYNQKLDKFITNKSDNQYDWWVNESLDFIDRMARTFSFFQWIQSNWLSRMALNLGRWINDYFHNDDTWVEIFGADMNSRNALNQTINSIWWELLWQLRITNDIWKIIKDIRTEWFIDWVGSWLWGKMTASYAMRWMWWWAWSSNVEFASDSQLFSFLFAASTPEMKARLKSYNIQNTTQNLFDNWWWGLFFWNALQDSVPLLKWIKKIKQWFSSDILIKENADFINIINSKDYIKSLNNWSLSGVNDLIRKSWNPDAQKYINWINDFTFRVITDKSLIGDIEKDLLDKNVPSDIENWTINDYILSYKDKFILEKSMIWDIMKNNPEFVTKYWNLDIKAIDDMISKKNNTKEDKLWKILYSMKIDDTQPWGSAIKQKLLASTVYSNLTNWLNYVDNKWEIRTKEETVNNYLNQYAKEFPVWSKEFKDKYYEFYSKKKKTELKNFKGRFIYNEDWSIDTASSSDEKFQNVAKNKVVNMFYKYVKVSNFEDFNRIANKVTYTIENQINKNTELDIFEAPKWVNANEEIFLSNKAKNVVMRELLVHSMLENWDNAWYLANNNWFWKAELYVPRWKDNQILKKSERTSDQKLNFDVLSTYLLKEQINNIAKLPSNDAMKVAAYWWLMLWWWYDVLRNVDKIYDQLPDLAKWQYEILRRNIIWSVTNMSDTVRDAIISESERLSWIRPWAWSSTLSSWKKWKSSGAALKANVDLVKALADKINEMKFNNITLPNTNEKARISFNPAEQKFIKESKWRTDAISKSYDDAKPISTKKWWIASNLTYWRWTASWSKKKGIKAIKII